MIHGGDIYRNDVKFDFSVSVNPLGMPKLVREILEKTISNLESYPDIQNEKLIEAISKVNNVDPERVAVGNGSSELFMAIAHTIRAKSILLPVPSYNGYKYVCDAISANPDHFLMQRINGFKPGLEIQDMIRPETGMIFIANPNNPTGIYVDRDVLVSIIAKCKKNKVIVVLDESFLELSDEPEKNTLMGEIESFDNLIIVRSFTKTYALPGLRLGYLVGGNKDLVEIIRNNLPEWNVSLPAQFAGIYALKDKEYLLKSRETVKNERKFLSLALQKAGMEVYPSNTNFLLTYSEKELYWALLRQGILIRDCSDFLGLTGGYFRIAIKDHETNVKLVEAIKSIN